MRAIAVWLLTGGWLVAALPACSFFDEPTEPAAALPAVAKRKAPRVNDVTVLPPLFARGLPPRGPSRAVVPAFMVMESKVQRPRAELRAGPGAQFELSDQVLPQGTRVLLFDRVGVWQKVLVVGTWQKGWVHSQALEPGVPNSRPIAVDMSRLPTVIAVNDISAGQAFRSLAPVKVAIPRGAQFRTLRIADGGTLVWLPQTNSTVWISGKDVQ
jgi:hypothetical protein